MGVGDQADLVDRPVDGDRGLVRSRLLAAIRGDRVEARSPGLAQVIDVGPFVLDGLAELDQRGVGVEGTVDGGLDDLERHRDSLRRQPWRTPSGSVHAAPLRPGTAVRLAQWRVGSPGQQILECAPGAVVPAL